MKARYIGGEAEAGSQMTQVFGMTIRCGQVFEVPPQFERKAQNNAAFEIIEDIPEAAEEEAPAAPKPRKKKEPQS